MKHLLTDPQAQLHTSAHTGSPACQAQTSVLAPVPTGLWLLPRLVVLLVFCWLLVQLLLHLLLQVPDQLLAWLGWMLP